MLDNHGVGYHGKGFLRSEEPMAACQQIPLQPALAQMLAEHFHNTAIHRDMIIHWLDRSNQAAVFNLKDRAEPIGIGLVRTEEAEVALSGIAGKDISQESAQL